MFKRNILLLFGIALTLVLKAQIEIPPIDYDALSVMDYAYHEEYEIAEITISGIEFIQKEALISLSGLTPGKMITVPGDDITKVVKKFWQQGLFSDVKVTASKIEDGKIWLDIYLKERPRLSAIKINGIKKSETEDLMKKLNIRTGSQVTDDVLNNIRRIIREHYTEKGFLNTEIKIKEIADTLRPNMVKLNVDVEKNKKVKIEEIIFSGNDAFPDKRLRRVLKKTNQRSINFFKSSKLNKKEYKEDKKKLIDFYNENGYRDAKILSDSLERISVDRIKLYIDLEEGNKYYFGNITWIGNTIYMSEYLAGKLGIKKGDVFDRSILNKRLKDEEDAVSSLYLDNGYLFSDIEAVETRIYNDTIDFEMRIYEGKQATISSVIIEGNTKTNEHVIRRELRTNPGDLFSKSDIIRTIRELAQLGHFDPEKIEPEPIPNPREGTVDLRYKLVEKANDQLEVSGGWGMGMLVGTIGLRFSNFSIKNLFNLSMYRPVPSGDGQTLSVRAQSNGKYYQAYNLSFVEPWFGGKKANSFSVSFYHTKMNDGLYSYIRPDVSSDKFIKISGASVGLGKRLKWPDDYFTIYNELSYQRYKLKEWDQFLFSNGSSNNVSVKTAFGRSSVSQPIYPRRGSSFSLGLQITPPYSLINGKDYKNVEEEVKYNWIEYHKWNFKADWYTTLAGNLVMYTRAHFGYLGHYNKDIGPSPFEGFDLGGDGLTGYSLYGRETIALRGYENGSLTPVVNGSKSGNVYNKLTLEIRYPFSLNPSATVFGLVFLEAGNAWYSMDQFNPFLIKRSAGVGLRAFLPMFGLLGVDWGYGFDDIPGKPDANKGQFHFTIGQQF